MRKKNSQLHMEHFRQLLLLFGLSHVQRLGTPWTIAYQLNGHDFEQTLGDSGGQRSLVYCSPWGRKETGRT